MSCGDLRALAEKLRRSDKDQAHQLRVLLAEALAKDGELS